jgi:hypothetical protein
MNYLHVFPEKEGVILAISNFIRKYKFVHNFYLEVAAVSVCVVGVDGNVVALVGEEFVAS